MKKRSIWFTLTGGLLTGLLIGLGVPAPIATGGGSAINEQAWEAADGGDEERSTQEQQAPEKGLLLDEGRKAGEGQAEETDGSVQLREEDGSEGRKDRLKEAATSLLIDEVTRSLDKSRE